MLSEESLNKTGVDLLLETAADNIVAQYLVETFEEEQPIGDVVTYFPEISTTEEKLKDMISKLLEVTGIPVPNRTSDTIKKLTLGRQIQHPVFTQLSLLEDDKKNGLSEETNSVKVPSELTETRIVSRELAPKIFWSLVKLSAIGKRRVTGSEISTVINRHLVDDLTKVEPTNISKALRGKALRSQSWLIVEEIASRKKLYGLSDNWQTYWVENFKAEPPNID